MTEELGKNHPSESEVKKPPSRGENKKALALEEYKRTMDIAIYEGSLYWQRFSVLFAINSAILIFLGVILGNEVVSLVDKNIQRTVVLSVCFLGYFFSAAMIPIFLRVQAFYRYWWNHLKKIERTTLTEFTLATGLDSHFDRQCFIRKMSVSTLTLFIPLSFVVLFGIFPALVYGLTNQVIIYLGAIVTALVFLILCCAISDWKRSWVRERACQKNAKNPKLGINKKK